MGTMATCLIGICPVWAVWVCNSNPGFAKIIVLFSGIRLIDVDSSVNLLVMLKPQQALLFHRSMDLNRMLGCHVVFILDRESM